MPKEVLPTKETGQRSIVEPYLLGYSPYIRNPQWSSAEAWRAWVKSQPIAINCRETLIANIEALDWKISPKDSGERDERKKEIDYYTDFLEYTGEYDFSEIVEWVCTDLLDLPFGSAIEVGREGDRPDGKVLWLEPLDAATLYPTLNKDYPVGQQVNGMQNNVIFPAHAIDRVYMSPRTEMMRKGWGMAPPEMIFIAIEMLNRGDTYYARLLLDSPTAGVLDLGDMERSSAEDWVQSLKSLLMGGDVFKIPVLYEHTTQAKFLPFGKLPNDLMFDRIIMKYASIVAAGYGMSLGDIGVSESANGGNTMAGTIRQERTTRKRGFSVIKKKLRLFFNRLLPSYLRFDWIDYDDELNVALGRARLANSTAFGQMIKSGYISPKEARLQTIADGMMTISMPEDIPEDEMPKPELPVNGNNSGKPEERPGLLGYPKPPSSGGEGEIKSLVVRSDQSRDTIYNFLKGDFDALSSRINDKNIRRMLEKSIRLLYPKIQMMSRTLSKSQYNTLGDWYARAVLDDSLAVAPVEIKAEVDDLRKEFGNDIENDDDDWWKVGISISALAAILLAAYREELRSVISEIVDALYTGGMIDNPNLDTSLIVDITNEKIKAEVTKRAHDIQEYINSGTLYFLVRSLLAISIDKLGKLSNKIREGLDVNEILSDNVFMQQLSQDVQETLHGVIMDRVAVYAEHEARNIRGQARYDEYKRVGLSKKKWTHRGADIPCGHCQANESLGWVDIDFDYSTAFGLSKAPPAHPSEHCDLSFDRGELFARFANPNFQLWTGE